MEIPQINTNNVIHIAPVVVARCCPECGHIESQLAIDAMRFNMTCPKGCHTTINDFQPID